MALSVFFHSRRALLRALVAFAAACGASDQTTSGVAANVLVSFGDSLPQCGACALTLQKITELGSSTDPVLLQRYPKVIRGARKRYVAAVPFVDRHEVVMFDSSGRFVRSIGRHGSGPGEFRDVTDIAFGENDSLFVLHELIRLTVFDSAGTYAGSVTSVGGLMERVWPLKGGLLLNGNMPSSELAGIPLHVTDRNALRMRSMGEVHIMAPYGGIERQVARGDGDSWWVASIDQYKIDNLDHNGNTTRSIGVEAPRSWYTVTHMTREGYHEHMAGARIIRKEQTGAKPVKAQYPPPFRVSGLYAGDGVLYVSMNVAKPGWEDATMEYYDMAGHVKVRDEAMAQMYRTVLDAIDIASGNVLTRTEIDGKAYLTNDGTLIRPRMNAHGIIQVDVFQVQLTR